MSMKESVFKNLNVYAFCANLRILSMYEFNRPPHISSLNAVMFNCSFEIVCPMRRSGFTITHSIVVELQNSSECCEKLNFECILPKLS